MRFKKSFRDANALDPVTRPLAAPLKLQQGSSAAAAGGCKCPTQSGNSADLASSWSLAASPHDPHFRHKQLWFCFLFWMIAFTRQQWSGCGYKSTWKPTICSGYTAPDQYRDSISRIHQLPSPYYIVLTKPLREPAVDDASIGTYFPTYPT